MIYRIATTAALVAGTFLLCIPAQAQTNSTGRGTSSNSASMGSMGSGAQNGSGMNSSDTNSSGRGQSANAVAQGGMNDQMNRPAGGRGEMNERQMTECLNNAAANRQPLGSCRR